MDWTWVKMTLLACSAMLALVGGYFLFICAFLVLGGEFDHGGLFTLGIGATCLSMGGLFAYTILGTRKSK